MGPDVWSGADPEEAGTGGVEDGDDGDEEEERREGDPDVDEALKDEVDLAAEVAGDDADEDGDEGGDEDGAEADEDGDFGAEDDAGEDVAAVWVGAEEEGGVGGGLGVAEKGVDVFSFSGGKFGGGGRRR